MYKIYDQGEVFDLKTLSHGLSSKFGCLCVSLKYFSTLVFKLEAHERGRGAKYKKMYSQTVGEWRNAKILHVT